jgi:hypothetical protein
MDRAEIKERWGNALTPFPHDLVNSTEIPLDGREFLIDVGLPDLEGTTYDSFYQKIYPLPRLSEHYHLMVPVNKIPREIQRSYVIAGDTYLKSCIAIAPITGEVIYFLPDEPWQSINSSVEKFCVFLTLVDKATYLLTRGEIDTVKCAQFLTEWMTREDLKALSPSSNYWNSLVEDLNYGMF